MAPSERAIDGFHGSMWERSGPESAYAGLVDDRPYEAPHGNGSNTRTLPQPLTDRTRQKYVVPADSPVATWLVVASPAALDTMFAKPASVATSSV